MILARAVLSTHVGFINLDGSFAIPPIYTNATDFSSFGIAGISNLEGQWSLITPLHTTVHVLGSEVSNMLQGSNGVFAFESRAKWGFLNCQGLPLIEPRFLDPKIAPIGTEVMQFIQGQAAVLAPYGDLTTGTTMGAIGVIAPDGTWIVEPDPVYHSYGDGSLVIDCRNLSEPGDPPYGFDFRSYGRISGPNLRIPYSQADRVRTCRGGVIPFARNLSPGNERDHLDYIPPESNDDRQLAWGLIRSDGALIHSAEFEDIKEMSEGLCPFQTEGKWGYLNESGTVQIAPEFADAAQFSNGLAAVMNESGFWGFIDHHRNWKVPPRFNSVGPFIRITL